MFTVCACVGGGGGSRPETRAPRRRACRALWLCSVLGSILLLLLLHGLTLSRRSGIGASSRQLAASSMCVCANNYNNIEIYRIFIKL